MKQTVINSATKNILTETCGFSCHYTPDKCECFGIIPDEVMKDLGLEEGDNREEDAFYEMEHCSYYDKIRFENKSVFEEQIKHYIDENFKDYKEDEKEIIFEKAIKLECEGGDWTWYLTMTNIANYISKMSKDNNKRKEYVYLLQSDSGTKIGRSYNPKDRTGYLGTKVPFKIKKTEIFQVESMSKTECGLHREYSKYRLEGEWFDLSEAQIKEIREYLKSIVPTQKRIE